MVEQEMESFVMNPIDLNNESTLFVIDCSPAMLTPRNGRVPVLQVLHYLEKIFLNKMHDSKEDRVGILLYNTGLLDASADKHACFFYDLNYPSTKLINHMSDLSTGWLSFDEIYGSTRDGISLEQVLWMATDAFKSKGTGAQLGRKQIVLITTQDDPHSDQPEERTEALRYIESLHQSLVTKRAESSRHDDRNSDIEDPNNIIKLIVCGIDRPEHAFNYSLFYKEFGHPDIFGGYQSSQSNVIQSPSSILKKVLPMVTQNRGLRNTAFHLPLHLTEGATIGVTGISVARRQKRPNLVEVTKNEGGVELVEKSTYYEDMDTGQNLRLDTISSAFEYGGLNVPLSKEDIKKAQYIREPGIVVLGFKPRKAHLPHHTIGRTYFIAPDESAYSGSTEVLRALHTTLTNSDKICYTFCVFSGNSAPRVMVLMPQKSPSGFAGILLPYTEEIRALPIESTPEVSKPLLESAERLVGHRKPNDDDIWGYPDPSIERHRRLLDAIALQRDIQEITEQPLTEPVDRTLEPFINQFKATVTRENNL
ncbi:SPOC like C-terminal domain-containing protein [Phycomyces blakesleeanus]|uniref:SPOC like C-terminal domain-containing protein n=1 Tax=Phycomyces blakesleeanus TaxID=4837 RepID=A0ABR3ALW3_PHYBL